MMLTLTPSAVTFLEMQHDSWCPALASGRGGDCQCTPTMRLHNDEQHYLRTELRTRAARRRAKREAEKALRKARKKP